MNTRMEFQNIEFLREENRNLRAALEEANATIVTIIGTLNPAVTKYEADKKLAMTAVSENNAASNNAVAKGYYYTPPTVIDLVSNWKKSAIALAEIIVDAMRK